MLWTKCKPLAAAAILSASACSATAGGTEQSTQPQSHIFPTSATLFAPVGFGADLGTVYAGLGFVNRWPGTTNDDGYLLMGTGLGNGEKYVGFSATMLLDSIGFHDGGFGNTGSFSVKMFRWLSPNLSVAVGGANVGRWGALKENANSWYGSMTDYFSFFDNGRFPMSATFGFGTGAFFSVADAQKNYDGEIKPFGAFAVSLVPQLSIIADYTSDIWSSGFSIVPYLKFPFAVTAYMTNLGGGEKKSGPITYGVRAAIGWTFS